MLLLKLKKMKGAIDIIHFVGIGGIGMSGIAEIVHNLGYKVQGSDIIANYNTERLENSGIKIFKSHEPENILNASFIVVSSAIQQDNPEIKAALNNKIPVIKRAEMLAELMRLKCSVAISGSHGKTTTTSLVACLFEAAGLLPTVINGGIINNKHTNAYIGSSDYLIAEADESDATFIKIPATIGVITNIDPEHMDFYKNFNNLVSAFKSFITNLPFYGFAVVCIDHTIVKDLIKNITERKIITYGIDTQEANILAFNINCDSTSSTFDVKINLPHVSGTTIIEHVTIPTPGRHNVLNALAAIGIGIELDFGLKVIKNGFSNFKGVKRRFTKIGEYNGATLIDDYAHHPQEVIATLETAKNVVNKQNGKVIAIFQPHRYSRLQYLLDDFITCFNYADQIYITEVYSAGEKEIEGVSGEILVNKIKTGKFHDNVEYISSNESIEQIIINNVNSGDIVIFMGAGSISSIANKIASSLTVKCINL